MARFLILLIFSATLSFAQSDIVSVVPPQHAVNVDPSETVSVTFGRSVKPESLNDSTIIVTGAQSGWHGATIAYDSLARTVALHPLQPFANGERVQVTLTGVVRADSSLPVAPFSYEFFVAATAADTAAFLATAALPAGLYPWALVSADIDGDGDRDIAVVNKGDHSISLMVNGGNGRFAKQQDVPVTTDPAAVAALDIDGDHDIDLAVAHTETRQVSLLMNNGSGRYAVGGTIRVGPLPTSLCVADVDGNGSTDLIAGGDSVTVIMNPGDPAFTATSFMPSGENPLSVTTADVDRDGDTDLLTTNYFSNDISVLLNDGKGEFSEFSRVAAGGFPSGATTGDWDGDGDVDLAVVSGIYPGTVAVALNEGNGVFVHVWTVVTGLTPLSVAAADVDGNGTLDLLTTNWESNSISVLRNDGTGFFTLEASPPAGQKPRGLAVADFDGDGDVDLATASQDASDLWILKKVNFSFVGSVTPGANARQVPPDSRIAVTFSTPIDSTSLNESTLTVDGSWTGRHRSTIQYSAAARTADLLPAGSFLPGEEVRVSVSTGVLSARGDTTINAYTWVFTVASAQAPLTFGIRQDVAVAGSPRALTAADLNDDGRIDVIAGGEQVSVLLNTGERSYGVMSSWNAGPRPYALAPGDLDGDGAPDLAVVNAETSTVRLYFNDGTGAFPASTIIGSSDTYYSQVAILDYTGDGRQDVVAVGIGSMSYSPTMTSLFRNGGNRTFTWQQDVEFDTDERPPSSIAVADFQRDGRLDLAWSSPDISIFTLLMGGKGAGTFQRFDLPNQVLTAIDLEGDSTMDLATLAGATLWLLRNGGNGDFTEASVTLAGFLPAAIAAADIDADGDVDIAVARGDSALVTLWLNNGTGAFTRGPSLALDSMASAVVIADLDGDDDLDVAAADPLSGIVRLFFNEDSSAAARVNNLSAVIINPGRVEVRWNTSAQDSILGFEVLRRREGETLFTSVPGGFVQAGPPSDDSSRSYVFQDTTAGPGEASYRLRQIDPDSSQHFSQVVTARIVVSVPEAVAPAVFALLQNYPNPFNPTTTIAFSVSTSGPATVAVYNTLGQLVTVAWNGTAYAGQVHRVAFDGRGLASGVYMYRLQTSTFSATRKMLLLK